MFNCLHVCLYMYVHYSTFHCTSVGSLVSVGVGSWCGMVKVSGSNPL
jgi:hypothetical protein